jgi:hypothetical protein
LAQSMVLPDRKPTKGMMIRMSFGQSSCNIW